MTKKHFIAVAKIIKDSKGKKEIAEKLSNYFATHNNLFDRNKFMEACKG